MTLNSIQIPGLNQPIAYNGNREALRNNAVNSILSKSENQTEARKSAQSSAFTEQIFKESTYVSKHGKVMEDAEVNRLLQGLDDMAEDFSFDLLFGGGAVDKNIMGNMAAEYSKLLDYINSTYNGDEKADMLAALNNRYDEQIKVIAGAGESAVRMTGIKNECGLVAAAFRERRTANIYGELPQELLNGIYDETKQFFTLASLLHNSLLQMGKDALSGNLDNDLSNMVNELLMNVVNTKPNKTVSLYSKKISELEEQLQKAIIQQQNNKTDEKTSNYLYEINKSRTLGDTVEKAKEQLITALIENNNYDETNQLDEIKPDSPNTPEEIKAYYLNRFISGTVISNNYSPDYSTYAVKYAEVRKEIESKYSGAELETHLKWLDESYDNYLNNMADIMDFMINSQALTYDIKINVDNQLIKDGVKAGNIVKYDKDAFKHAFEILKQKMREAIIHYGTLSKQYIIDGNTAPVSEDEKETFNDYLIRNTNTNAGILSLSDINMITTMLTPKNEDTIFAVNSVLEKFNFNIHINNKNDTNIQ
jgi:hypothetical protein